MRKIIYIVNPISGAKQKNKLRELIEKKTGAANIPFQIFPSVASGDYNFMLPIVEEEKVTDVVIAGGDGTVSQVVHSLLKTSPQFGIIPCGSGNGLAFTAKIPRDPEKALDLVFKGHSVLTDGFTINNHFACMLSGLGFDASVALNFSQQPKRGLATYVKEVVRQFFSAKTYSFEIKLQESTFQADAYFISIANSNQFGNNFRIAPKASLSDGLLDIVIACHQSKLSLLLQTFKQISGYNKLQTGSMVDKEKAVIYFQAESLEILNKSLAPLHIDGEPAETPETINIEIIKKCFRLIQP